MSENKCPECGFGIFNRRYAKCEKCGIALPESMAMSRQELHAVQERERQEDELAAELKKDLVKRSLRKSDHDGSYSYYDGGSSGGAADCGSGGGDCSA